MKDFRLKLLVKQSKFNKDITKIIDTIAPFICDKKITKREIDKANVALKAAFGEFFYYKKDDGTEVYQPYYQISKYNDYGTRINIICFDRSISMGDNYGYMPENTRTIYISHGEDSITVDDLNKYKYSDDYCPTEKQILTSYATYQDYKNRIKELENKISELPFHYYFKDC